MSNYEIKIWSNGGAAIKLTDPVTGAASVEVMSKQQVEARIESGCFHDNNCGICLACALKAAYTPYQKMIKRI